MAATARDGRTVARGRRATRPLAGLALAAVLLAGCAGSGDDTTSSGPGTGPGLLDTTTTAATSTSASGGPAVTTTTASAVPVESSTTTTAAPTTTTTTLPVTAIEEPPGALQSGSKGKRTLAIQQALKDQHYDPGEPDGKFGLKTTQSIWAFQALHGLPADGVVSPELEAQVLARTPQPMLRPNLGPTHTEVDLTRQVLIVFRGGAPTLITHVSSGSQVPYCEDTDQGRNCGNAVTPLGVFTFYRQVQGIRDAPLGKLYDPVYFHGGFAVHGSPSVPNHPASHGCVRIPMSISGYFQSLVNLGETIEVFRS